MFVAVNSRTPAKLPCTIPFCPKLLGHFSQPSVTCPSVSTNSFSQGWFSPGQVFVLDEYCARYGVRGCYRHLCYLSDLLDKAEKNIMIDPTLIHYSFAFCASHVHGNRCVVFELELENPD